MTDRVALKKLGGRGRWPNGERECNEAFFGRNSISAERRYWREHRLDDGHTGFRSR